MTESVEAYRAVSLAFAAWCGLVVLNVPTQVDLGVRRRAWGQPSYWRAWRNHAAGAGGGSC